MAADPDEATPQPRRRLPALFRDALRSAAARRPEKQCELCPTPAVADGRCERHFRIL